MSRIFLFLGAIAAFLAVALGAFGAHLLHSRLPDDLYTVYQTGVHYHAIHALGLLVIGLLARDDASRWMTAAGMLMATGLVLFSGSLYALALSGARGLGIVTPFGGLALLAAWFSLAVAVGRQPRGDD